MAKRTFAARTFASRTFAAATWGGSGEAITASGGFVVQAAQFYTAGAVAGAVVPNVIAGQGFIAGVQGGDVK